eukprot:TRINITY_DN11440_c0_g1_i1.p1 TRINITY_DN11440_c0_g1~~TRINITY_DN11440_c0_g1_i1.p1  ORF type:complete len:342 (+),score=60.91 TRINITY_DN11440_c0_g1_i1:101-1126(+)
MKSFLNGAQQSGLVRTVLIVSLYLFASVGTVLLNKLLLSNSGPSLPCPSFVTWFQMIVAIPCLSLMKGFGFNSINLNMSLGDLINLFTPRSLMETLRHPWQPKNILTISLTNVSIIVLKGYCLQKVDMFVYQVAGSLAIVFSALMSVWILKESISANTIFACAIVCAGYMLTCVEEISGMNWGFLYGLAFSVIVPMYSVLAKLHMRQTGSDEWYLISQNSIMGVILLAPVVLGTGDLSCVAENSSSYPSSMQMWSILVVSGIFGFFVSVAIFFMMGFLSPLSIVIVTTLKACIQSALGILFMGDSITFANATGVVFCIVGAAYYSYTRSTPVVVKKKVVGE